MTDASGYSVLAWVTGDTPDADAATDYHLIEFETHTGITAVSEAAFGGDGWYYMENPLDQEPFGKFSDLPGFKRVRRFARLRPLPPMDPPTAEGVCLWSCDPTAEELNDETVDEAMHSFWDNALRCHYPDCPKELKEGSPEYDLWVARHLSKEPVVAAGYSRQLLSEKEIPSPLEEILENLDCEYGRPGEPTEPTAEMENAEECLRSAVHRGYEPWTCNKVEERHVNLLEWLVENKLVKLEET